MTVIELGHVVAAPYATQMLSDLGAEVVKVENSSHGDHMRVSGQTGRAIFVALNRGKMSVTLNLRSDDDRADFKALVRRADILVENFAPGSMDRLGLGYETLSAENSELIYVSIKGYDSSGPYGDRGATDPIVQAMSGILSVTGYSEMPPARAGVSVVDITTAQNAVVATTLALNRRLATGNGTQVTVPMFKTGVAMMGYWLVYSQLFDDDLKRRGASHPLYAPYNVYPTTEGHIFIGATNDSNWNAIRTILGLQIDFESGAERLDNRDRIDDAIADATTTWSRSELVEELLDASVPAAPVNEVSDVLADSHLDAVDGLTMVDLPETDDVAVPWTVPWSAAPDASDGPPSLGDHTETVVSEEDETSD